MSVFILKIVFTTMILFWRISLLCSQSAARPSKGNQMDSATPEVMLDLLIICDKEFSDILQQNRQHIIDYWRVYLWDINMRFKTLSTVNLSFRVSQIITMKNISDQPFIEKSRISSNGTIDLLRAFRKFSEWTYSNEKNFTNFHIAILITGARVSGNLRQNTYIKGLCTKNDQDKMHHSIVAIRHDSTWGYSCGVLESALALLVGAPHDKDTSSFENCNSNEYIMGDTVCGNRNHFFSKCSSEGIANFLTTSNASCLQPNYTVTKNIFDAYTTTTPYPPSLDEQCVMITNNSCAHAAKKGGNHCFTTKCLVRHNGSATYTQNLYPVDNSPCGNHKFCFRGRCVSRAFQIRNVISGLCIQSVNRFVSNDYPAITDCLKDAAPLDKFRVLDKGPLGKFLVTPYSSLNEENENSDKCLSVDLHEERLEYENCNTGDQKWLGWNLIKVEKSRGEFLLFHRQTKMCAIVHRGSSVTLNETCNRYDRRMRWKFHERFDVPESWFRTRNETENSTIFPLRRKDEWDSYTEETDYGDVTDIHPHSTESTSVYSEAEKCTPRLYWGMVLGLIVFGVVVGAILLHFLQQVLKNRKMAMPQRYENQSVVWHSHEGSSLDTN